MPRNKLEIDDDFLDEQLFASFQDLILWYTILANYLVSGYIAENFEPYQKKKLLIDDREHYWDEPYLYWICVETWLEVAFPKLKWLCLWKFVVHLRMGVTIVVLKWLPKFFKVGSFLKPSIKTHMTFLRGVTNAKGKEILQECMRYQWQPSFRLNVLMYVESTSWIRLWVLMAISTSS